MPPNNFMSLLGDPGMAAAAGLLDPRGTFGNFGSSLSNGINQYLAAQRAGLRQELLRQEIQKQQAQAAQQAQQQAALAAVTKAPVQQGPRRPQFQGQPLTQQSLAQRDPQAAAQQMMQAGDFAGAQAIMKMYGGGGANIGAVSPSSFTPASVAKYRQSGSYADLVPVPKSPLVVNQYGNQPMSPSDLMKFRNAKGETPPINATPDDLLSGGFKMKSTEEQSQMTGSKGALSLLDRLEGLAFDKESPVFVEYSGISGRSKQGLQNVRAIAAQEPESQNLVLYNDLAQGSLSVIVRALGEKGQLAESDIARIRPLLPKVTPMPDSPDTAKEKFKELRGVINEISGRAPNTNQKMVEVDGVVYVIGADGQARPLVGGE